MEKPAFWVFFFPIVLLGIALFEWPYGYYQFLRVVITAASIWVAMSFNSVGQNVGTIVFGIVAILYNPIAKIHMERETHEAVNVATACLFLAAWFLGTRQKGDMANDRKS